MSWGIDSAKSLEEQLEYYKLLEDEINRRRETFGEIVEMVCASLSCDNCPVVIHNADTRTKYEKEVLHHSCYGELYKWIINEAKIASNKR